MMKRLYLYRLYRFSKLGFMLVVCFIAMYIFFFSKKMDAVFFPYNSMFSVTFHPSAATTTYAVAINNKRIVFTGNVYWKKDFLEESLINYSKYKTNGNRLFMHEFLEAKKIEHASSRFPYRNLLPVEKGAPWLQWYVVFAGYTVRPGDELSILAYKLRFADQQVQVTDSMLLFKTIAL